MGSEMCIRDRTRIVTDWNRHRLELSQTGIVTDWNRHRLESSQTGIVTDWNRHRLEPSQTRIVTDWNRHRLEPSQTGTVTDWNRHRLEPSQTRIVLLPLAAWLWPLYRFRFRTLAFSRFFYFRPINQYTAQFFCPRRLSCCWRSLDLSLSL